MRDRRLLLVRYNAAAEDLNHPAKGASREPGAQPYALWSPEILAATQSPRRHPPAERQSFLGRVHRHPGVAGLPYRLSPRLRRHESLFHLDTLHSACLDRVSLHSLRCSQNLGRRAFSVLPAQCN